MARLLILDGVNSTLSHQRGVIGALAGHAIYWYAQSLGGTETLPLAERSAWLSGRVPAKLQRPCLFADPLHLLSLIRRWKIDLVHVHYAFQYLLPLAVPKSIPMVVTVMGGDVLPDQFYRGRWRPPLTNLLLERAAVITVKSAYLEQAVTAINLSWARKIERISWGIDTALFRPDLPVEALRARYALPANALVFFDLRLAQRFYRKHVILQAFARLPRDIDAVLLIAEYKGDPAYLAELRELVKTLGVEDRVRFVGGIPHDEMAHYLCLADVTVAVPPSDGMPQSLYEAMACGAYPIAGNLPQYAELLEDGVNASLVPLGEDERAVDALYKAMLDAARDPSRRERAVNLNYQRIVSDFDRATEAARMNAIYARLLTPR